MSALLDVCIVRFTGRITDWKDDRGYGFIEPDGGAERVFFHIKAFAVQRRPVVGDAVGYELGTDRQGRPRAVDVRLVGQRARLAAGRRRGAAPLMLAAGFLALLTGSAMIGMLPWLLVGLYLVVSVGAFLAYGFDKWAAQGGRWRTPESTLHLWGLAGGWPGAIVAQRLLRHKSRKRSFQTLFWGTVLVNCAVLVWLHTPQGGAVLGGLLRG